MTRRRGLIGAAAAVALLVAGAGSAAAPPQGAPSHEGEMYEAIVTAKLWKCEHDIHEALTRRDEKRRQRTAIEGLVEQLEQCTDPTEQEDIKRRIEIRSLGEFIAVQIWSQAISDARMCVRQKGIVHRTARAHPQRASAYACTAPASTT